MFSLTDINNLNLPDKTLCLTYDDGPGPDSLEIGRFLHQRGIRATFFVVGKFAIHHPEILDELSSLGHIIGSHTFEHPDMPYYTSINGDVRDQIIRTNGLIQKYSKNDTIYFRAPYGKWSPEVANELNQDLRSSYKMVGPIHWDIAGIDCYYWKLGRSVDDTVETYFKEVNEKGKGVIVMHDEIADMDIVKPLNKTLELTKLLIPRLQDSGYKFVNLDEIQDPQLTTPLDDRFALRGQNGKYLKYLDKEGESINWNGETIKANENSFYLELKLNGKVVIRTFSGKFLRVDPEVDETVRIASEFDEYALFDYIPITGSQFVLRTYNGNFFAADHAKGGLLKANAPFIRQAWCMSYTPTTGAYKRTVSFRQKLRLCQKRLLFVKSKILQS